MKKVLLATTILVAGASVAAAEVTLSGDARMGILSEGGADAIFTSRARVSFGLSGESDSGLSFGASFRADNASSASSGSAGSVFVSGAFGKLSMGDVDGAANAAVGQVAGVGLTGLGDKNEIGYLANGGFSMTVQSSKGPATNETFSASAALTADPSVLYEYTAGDFTVYASTVNPSGAADAYALGAAYKFGDIKVSAGYEVLDGSATVVEKGTDPAGVAYSFTTADKLALDLKHVVVGVEGTFSGVTLKAVYGKATGTYDDDWNGDDGSISGKQYAVSASYTADALTATAFYSKVDMEGEDMYTFPGGSGGVSLGKRTTTGVGVAYDLGGGAKAVAGIVKPKGGKSSYDLGLSFSF